MIGNASDPTGDVPVPTVRVIVRAVRDADTVYIAFPRLQRALVVDFRQGEGHQPAALAADLGFTVEERRGAVEKLRPDLPPIERFVATVWGGSTRAFAEQGVPPAILDRLPPAHTRDVMAAVEELRAVERDLAPRRARPEAAEGGTTMGDDRRRVAAMQTIEEVKRQMRDLRRILDDIAGVLGEKRSEDGAATTTSPDEIGVFIRQLELLRSRLERPAAAGPSRYRGDGRHRAPRRHRRIRRRRGRPSVSDEADRTATSVQRTDINRRMPPPHMPAHAMCGSTSSIPRSDCTCWSRLAIRTVAPSKSGRSKARSFAVSQPPSATREPTDVAWIVDRLPVPADTLYHVPKRDQASDPATSHGPTKGGRLSRRR